MHGVIVRVSIKDADAAEERLKADVVPRVSAAPGFVNGYWLRSDDGTSGLSVTLFESEDAARAASEMARQNVPAETVTLEDVEVREVVASA
jgi:heme-degrading monooxygenase HmoA